MVIQKDESRKSLAALQVEDENGLKEVSRVKSISVLSKSLQTTHN